MSFIFINDYVVNKQLRAVGMLRFHQAAHNALYSICHQYTFRFSMGRHILLVKNQSLGMVLFSLNRCNIHVIE